MAPQPDRQKTETLRGSITSVGFSSGHRFVIGHWPVSPIGPFADVMWRNPDDTKTLIAPAEAVDYITAIYPFDHRIDSPVIVTEVSAKRGRRMEISSDRLQLSLDIGRTVVAFPPRPRWITATVERWLARALLGVNTHGISPTGVEEWYRTRSVRRVVDGRGLLNGVDLGRIGPLDRPMDVGFSEPPRQPTHVRLRVDVRRRH